MAEPAQSRVGGYRIIRKLAVGGMAEIFLARLEAGHGFTKQVVLKRLLPHLGEDPNFIAMFLHEARLAAGLSHPNIAQVFDIGESEGRLHYAMEYVHGPDLRDVAKRMHARSQASGEPPPLDLVVGVCIGVAAGLHYAHTARDGAGRALAIVHRDVTPSNVVVTYGGVAKLLDFGVAKAKFEGRESTAVGVLKGKLPYMSPEQIDASRLLDGRSDVFSLGVMLWELTTLHRLYRCGSYLETMRRITQQDAPPPSSVRADYPSDLEAIVVRALARDRDDRYASAFELQRELEQFALAHQLVVSGSRIAERMADLFAEELEDERMRLESEPREVTDSEVFMTHRAVESGPELDHDDGHDGADHAADHDAPTRVSVAVPLAVVALAEPEPEPSRAEPRSSRGWRLGSALAVAGGLALVLVLGLGGFQTDVPADSPASGPEPIVEQLGEPLAEPEPSKPASPGPSEPAAPASGPEPIVDTEPEPEPKPKPRKPARPSSQPKPKPKPGWDKNSLALPD